MPRRLPEDAWMLGTDNICSWYEKMAPADAPYFSVWIKRQLKFSYDGPSLQQGSRMLRDNLEPAEEAGMNALLTLRLHKKQQSISISDKSPYWASMDFKLCEGEAAPAYDYMGRIGGVTELEALRARVTALESEQSGGSGLMGAVNEFLRSDHLQPVFANAIAGLLAKIAPGIMPAPGGAPAGARMAHAVNGMIQGDEITERLYEALLALESADPDLEDDLCILAAISRENPNLFKILIQQLRSYATQGTNKGL